MMREAVCPRDKFRQICQNKQGGLLIEVRNNIFKTSEYLHPASHVPWDGIDPHWPKCAYAKQWSLSPWHKEPYGPAAPGIPLPIAIQYQLQEKMRSRSDVKAICQDEYGIQYIFNLQSGGCLKGGILFGLNYELISNYDWEFYDDAIQPLPLLTNAELEYKKIEHANKWR
jgi:hypothetical protein